MESEYGRRHIANGKKGNGKRKLEEVEKKKMWKQLKPRRKKRKQNGPDSSQRGGGTNARGGSDRNQIK